MYRREPSFFWCMRKAPNPIGFSKNIQPQKMTTQTTSILLLKNQFWSLLISAIGCGVNNLYDNDYGNDNAIPYPDVVTEAVAYFKTNMVDVTTMRMSSGVVSTEAIMAVKSVSWINYISLHENSMRYSNRNYMRYALQVNLG